MHAASLGMWAVHDSNAFLRRIIHIALVNDGLNCSRHPIRSRWRCSRSKEIQGIAQQIEGGFQYDSRVGVAVLEKKVLINILIF